jgi:hypothetical protein
LVFQRQAGLSSSSAASVVSSLMTEAGWRGRLAFTDNTGSSWPISRT